MYALGRDSPLLQAAMDGTVRNQAHPRGTPQSGSLQKCPRCAKAYPKL